MSQAKKKQPETTNFLFSAGPKYTDRNNHKRNESFVALHTSMMCSDAFLSLTGAQVRCLLVVYSFRYGTRKPSKDHPELAEEGGDFFYGNISAFRAFGLYRGKHAEKELKQHLAVLESRGFIKKVGCEPGIGGRRIYEYTAKWMEWRKDDTKAPQKAE